MVEKLLELGANPNAMNKFGMVPLHHAAVAGGSPEVIVALIKAGADVSRVSYLLTVPAGFCDHPPSEGLRSLKPARPLFLKEIWLEKVTFSTYFHKSLDIAASKRVDGRYFTT